MLAFLVESKAKFELTDFSLMDITLMCTRCVWRVL